MAVCSACNQEMLAKTSCTVTHVHVEGERYPRIPHGDEREMFGLDEETVKFIVQAQPKICHDCGVPEGGLHHPGCDVERCPRCMHQFISCSCEVTEGPVELIHEKEVVGRFLMDTFGVPTLSDINKEEPSDHRPPD